LTNNPLPGDIWLGRFGNANFGEIVKMRPFVVLAPIHQDDKAQVYVTLVPFSTKERTYRYHHSVTPTRFNGLTRKSWVACNQFVSAKKSELIERIGVIDVEHWHAIRSYIYEYFGF